MDSLDLAIADFQARRFWRRLDNVQQRLDAMPLYPAQAGQGAHGRGPLAAGRAAHVTAQRYGGLMTGSTAPSPRFSAATRARGTPSRDLARSASVALLRQHLVNRTTITFERIARDMPGAFQLMEGVLTIAALLRSGEPWPVSWRFSLAGRRNDAREG